ncbi:hypothetical protein [Rhizobium sp. CIAT894]|uniref:hypothetical protein n=1 Tax=Rhizobium sp. CIAT894 TaxID=2020312 RepID=UPI000190985B|nr:hypothetical protein [Rhizobium sp. CIAT894]
MRFRAWTRIRRHNRAATANTGGGLHRFFERARYFHDARNSGMAAQVVAGAGGFSARRPPAEVCAIFNGVNEGDFPC